MTTDTLTPDPATAETPSAGREQSTEAAWRIVAGREIIVKLRDRNFIISTRRLKTEAAAHDGDTVMLAGLISDSAERGAGGIPGLSRIPVLGALFGNQRNESSRSETIVLITARVVRNSAQARDLTDEYSRRFRAMEPLHRAQD